MNATKLNDEQTETLWKKARDSGMTRRKFLVLLAGSGVAAVLAACAPRGILPTTKPLRRYRFFTDYQAQVVEAATSRIIPTDDAPGAKEAGVVLFIDRALMEEDKSLQTAYISGVGFLDHTAEAKFQKPFLELSTQQQDDLLKAIETDPFFTTLRTHTIRGMFSDPIYGGNLDMVGWKLISFSGAMFHPLHQGHLEPGWRPVAADYTSLLSRYGEINPYGQ